MEKISSLIIGLVFGLMIILSGTFIISEINTSDNTFYSQSEFTAFNNTFAKVDKMQEYSDKIEDSISNSKPKWFDLSGIGALIETVWSTLTSIFSSIDFMFTMVREIPVFFGIPPFLANLFIMVLIFIVGFAIFSAVWQNDL